MGARPGLPRRFWRGASISFFVFCYLLAAGALVARAEVPTYAPPPEPAEPAPPEGQPACPALELEPYEGTDEAAGEGRLLRGEFAEVCAALSARLDRVRERVFWAVLQDVHAAEQRQVTNSKLDALAAQVEANHCASPCPVEVVGSSPVEVQDAAGAQYSDKLVSAVDASGEASKAGLYFLAGLVAALFIAFAFWKTVIDRGT